VILRSIRLGRMKASVVVAASILLIASSARAQTPLGPVHSMDVPQPRVVDPGPAGPSVPAPSDAFVLFDGHDLSAWRGEDGSSARWTVRDGYFEVSGGAGTIRTAEGFGDCQLHVEWMAPEVVKGDGQERGNSGVYLMGLYEVQVLDSYHNPTYPDGQASALYGQYPPLVNASRPPGQWQTYDIVFHAPRFDRAGKLMSPAHVTVLHNGVLVQDDVALSGPTAHQARPPYEAHAAKLPLMLQDHGNPVRYRNIWLRPLGVDR
jgi:hypothetical protein